MCKHERLRAVGFRLFCKDCGAELPIEFLTARKPVKTASEAAPAVKVNKSRGRKKTTLESE